MQEICPCRAGQLNSMLAVVIVRSQLDYQVLPSGIIPHYGYLLTRPLSIPFFEKSLHALFLVLAGEQEVESAPLICQPIA